MTSSNQPANGPGAPGAPAPTAPPALSPGGTNLSYGVDAWQNIGIGSGWSNITPGLQPALAQYNVGFGWRALDNITSGNYNTAVGAIALSRNTSGVANTAVGTEALANNVTGGNNTAVGQSTLQDNVGGNENTAVGWEALLSNTGGNNNVAIGTNALLANTTASNSTAVGMNALVNHTTGGANTAIGYQAGAVVTTGEYNTFVGHQAGFAGGATNWYTTCVGKGTSATGQGGVAIGIDHTGASATAAQDVVALGTALHQVQVLNNATGAGSAALGANCPATTLTAPYKWFKMMTADGSTVYVPAWK